MNNLMSVVVNKFKLIFLFLFFIVASLNSATIVGLASWYGDAFHGKTTANGEDFDMTALTAAHKELPFNTVVRVTNLLNNRKVTVRINDRGPFRKDRIIDLSKAAAEKLDFLGIGVAPVKVEILEKSGESVVAKSSSSLAPEKNEKDQIKETKITESDKVKVPSNNSIAVMSSGTSNSEHDFYIQVGSYKTRDYASRASKTLQSSGLSAVVNHHEPFYTVFVPVNADDVQKTVEVIKSSGYKDMLVRKTKVPGTKIDLE